MGRGKAKIKVAVIHPIETFWLYWGSSEQTAVIRNKLEEQFAKLTEHLIFGQIDFDFICEADLPYQCKKPSNPLEVGQMSYDAVIVCGSKTMRSTTASRLEAFAKNGEKDALDILNEAGLDLAKLIEATANSLLPYKAKGLTVTGGLVNFSEYWKTAFEEYIKKNTDITDINAFIGVADSFVNADKSSFITLSKDRLLI